MAPFPLQSEYNIRFYLFYFYTYALPDLAITVIQKGRLLKNMHPDGRTKMYGNLLGHSYYLCGL